MPKLSEVFPSKYMKAETDVIEGEDITVVIRDVVMEEFDNNGKKEKKPVLYFKGHDKGMVCNKTNATTIAALYGDDTDDWEGKPIGLCSMQVQGPQGMVDSIRVKKRAPKATAGRPEPAAPEKAPKASSSAPSGDDDDQIPF